jgi:gluconate 5-dehydrogenase
MLRKIFSFSNKVVLITGSSGQIGREIVKLYLSLGARVYGFDLNQLKLKDKNFFFVKIDITNSKKTKIELDYVFKKEKKIDIIINNAGTSVYTRIEKRNDDELQKVFDLNIRSVINIIKNYYINYKKYYLKSGSIINIASIYGFLSPDFEIYKNGERFSAEIYGATKASVIQITKYFAVLLAKNNIRVNSISPGGILNKRMQTNRFIKNYSARVPLKRMANVDDLFTTIVYLSSDHSKYVTGQNVIVDGGLSAK